MRLDLKNLESSILIEGPQQAVMAIRFLKDMGRFMSGQPGAERTTTNNFEGGTRIICGRDPIDDRFFVGDTSVFNKDNPKICKSEQDCYKFYDGMLSNILATAFKYLSGTGIDSVLAANILFTSDLKSNTIDGNEYLVFKPGKTAYSVLKTSSLGKEIATARMGVVFFRKFTGPNLENMTAGDVSPSDYKENSSLVWTHKGQFNNIGPAASFTGSEKIDYFGSIEKAEHYLRESRNVLGKLLLLSRDRKLANMIKEFIYENMNSKRKPHINVLYDQMSNYLSKEFDKNIMRYQNINTKAKKADELSKKIDFLVSNERQLKSLLNYFIHISNAKIILINKLEQIQNTRMFEKRGTGDFKVIDSEKFVGISGRESVRLVSDMKFSKYNFRL